MDWIYSKEQLIEQIQTQNIALHGDHIMFQYSNICFKKILIILIKIKFFFMRPRHGTRGFMVQIQNTF